MPKQGRNWRVGRVGNCPLRFWQNWRHHRAAEMRCITNCPTSFRQPLTLLLNIGYQKDNFEKYCGIEDLHLCYLYCIVLIIYIWHMYDRFFEKRIIFQSYRPWPPEDIWILIYQPLHFFCYNILKHIKHIDLNEPRPQTQKPKRISMAQT